MTRCSVCKKSNDDVEIFKGISADGLIPICRYCSNREGITLLKQPTHDQLKRADERYTVRERMERLSGLREISDISQEQEAVQRNLARLRAPEKKEFNNEVVDNYFWNLKIARRRRKMTESQLAAIIGVSSNVIHTIERGKLPVNYKEIFLKIEAAIGIKMLKNHGIPEVKTKEDEERVIREVKMRMQGVLPEFDEDYIEIKKHREKKEKVERITRGEIDISKRMDLNNVTINDLVEMKKSRERQKERIAKRESEEILGDDIDLELDEV
jgi:ribosome-binding protein aMBF1 (putative translation factor)